MNDTIPGTRVGIGFQKTKPFPQSIYNNVAFGLRVLGKANEHSQLAIAM